LDGAVCDAGGVFLVFILSLIVLSWGFYPLQIIDFSRHFCIQVNLDLWLGTPYSNFPIRVSFLAGTLSAVLFNWQLLSNWRNISLSFDQFPTEEENNDENDHIQRDQSRYHR